MHQQAGARRQRLAVDVLHRCLRADRDGQVRQLVAQVADVDLQVVAAGRVGRAAVLLLTSGATDGPQQSSIDAKPAERGRRRTTTASTARTGTRPSRVASTSPADAFTCQVDRGCPQRPAGVVVGVHGDGRRLTGDVRPGALGPHDDLELGPAELLDLEHVPVLLDAPEARRVDRQLEVRLAQVRPGGDRDGQVEAAQRVDVGLALGDDAALRVARRVGDDRVVGEQPDLRIGARRQPPDPSLDRRGLARSIGLPVVEHVPQRRVARPATAPIRRRSSRWAAAPRRRRRSRPSPSCRCRCRVSVARPSSSVVAVRRCSQQPNDRTRHRRAGGQVGDPGARPRRCRRTRRDRAWSTAPR